MRFGLWLSALIVALLVASPGAAQSRFDGWAAAVVAADWRTSRGQPIEAFDNARRDLTAAFLQAGFARDALVDRSLRPDRGERTTAEAAVVDIERITSAHTRGCLLYFTSHGSPGGIVFGPNALISPDLMANLVREWCGARPAVVVVSACFSGVFVDALAAPNRMVLTAAARDRASFGCSEEATYPYFDGCILESLPGATDFIALANAARACVARREAEEGLTPASNPQLFIGAEMQLLLPTLRFRRPG
jgi:hypothetical protein